MAENEGTPEEARKDRHERIKAIYKSGVSVAGIAKMEGVSRQRIDQIIYRLAHSCRRKTRYLVNKGKLPHPKTLKCFKCGGHATEYDHRDYSDPRKVKATCHLCNVNLGPGENQSIKKGNNCMGSVGVTNLVPMSVDIGSIAKELEIGRSYLVSILRLKIRPGATLTLRICSKFENIEPYMLRPDVFCKLEKLRPPSQKKIM